MIPAAHTKDPGKVSGQTNGMVAVNAQHAARQALPLVILSGLGRHLFKSGHMSFSFSFHCEYGTVKPGSWTCSLPSGSTYDTGLFAANSARFGPSACSIFQPIRIRVSRVVRAA